MSANDMATCWEAFSLTKKVSELTNHTFEAYKTQVYKHSDQIPPTTQSSGAVQSRNVKRQAASMVTPPAKRFQTPNKSSVDAVAVEGSSPAPLPTYDDRQKAGQVAASFNPKEWPAIQASTAPPSQHRCVVDAKSFEGTSVTAPYRHMFTAISERAQALEDRLQHLSREIIDKYGISNGENGIAPLEQVNIPRQEAVTCVGRICNEVSKVGR